VADHGKCTNQMCVDLTESNQTFQELACWFREESELNTMYTAADTEIVDNV